MDQVHNFLGPLDDSDDEQLLEDDALNTDSLLHQNDTSLSQKERRLKTRLRYFFMAPCQKWKYRGRKPFKLAIQIAKIIIITLQVLLFGFLSMETADYMSSNLELFRTIFLHEDSAPATLPDNRHGGLAIAQKEDLYYSLNHARKMYSELHNRTFDMFGTNFKNNSIKLTLQKYNDFQLFPSSGTYVYDPRNISTEIYTLPPFRRNESISSQTVPVIINSTVIDTSLNFQQLIKAHLLFNVRTIRLKASNEGSTPDCVEHRVKIHYDNSEHSGIVGYWLSADQHYNRCKNSTEQAFQSQIILYTILDTFCLCLCLVSGVLCVRSIVRAQMLNTKFVSYFQSKHQRRPSLSAQLHFLNYWYIGIIISDFLIIIGSMLKMDMQNKWVGMIDYSACQMLLGVGIGITYIGLLRYIGYFRKYNILVTVLKASLPHCGRFLVTTGVLYTGFTLCGWLVLGPYNPKFRTITRTSECLFSLLNGDDMYNTFELLGVEGYNNVLVVFNQIYLYSFISIFIYVVLNLLLAVIIQTYDSVVEARGGPEKHKPDELEKFLGFTILDSSDPIRLNF